MRDDNKVWEQQRGESQPAYDAFCRYRDLGDARSLKSVANTIGKSHSLVEDWNRVNNWQARVRAYNTHLDRVDRKERRADMLKMARRHAQIAAMFQEKVIKRLRALDPAGLEPSDLIRFFDISAKVERESRRFGTHDIAAASDKIGELAMEAGVGLTPNEAKAVSRARKGAAKLNLADAIRGETLAEIWEDDGE
jgi:hypothetical protein